ncbi:hypothetical protein N7456_000282 [Penicillium angulare]|uniref:Uncharacterized protein n=1 Tax=Penicillium angulare TaxID=116970 RepID=A0A9W9GBQ9_9EURO|nr:hypothetical protein N7456_000282 [Penicillium angulare]
MNSTKSAYFKNGRHDAQATQSILHHDVRDGPRVPWRRVPIRNSIRSAIEMSILLLSADTKEPGSMAQAGSLAATAALWIPASIVVLFAMFPMVKMNSGRLKFGVDKIKEHRYKEFIYDYSGMASTQAYQSPECIQTGRLLRPRYLCLADKEPKDRIVSVLHWERLYGPQASLEYLFIAYTAEQFPSNEDLDELHRIAALAAKAAGLPAYWISCSCMPNDEKPGTLPDQAVDLAGDLYRISDVVRGSHSLVIIAGTPGSSTRAASTETLLREWGRRMWTFPEVLLSPSHKEITIYKRGDDLNNPLRVRKALFPRLAWADASESQQLIDHYEGIQPLGYLQVVSLGLKCLAARKTTAWFPGDMIYALQGLLWCRPKVNPNDTDFQAFCRLSLANDSNHLLERLICLSPPNRENAWHNLDDFWNCKLWNINTSCQVLRVIENDTVIISGAFGCSIQWDSFPRVVLVKSSAKTTRETSTPLFSLWSISCSTFTAGAIMAIVILIRYIISLSLGLASSMDLSFRIHMFMTIGLLAAFVVFCLPLPYLLYCDTKSLDATISGPIVRAHPHLIGFEGYLDLETIETILFGFTSGHLRWSVECSNLSRSRQGGDQRQDLVGIDPYTSDPEIRDFIQRNIEGGISVGQPRIFTLVDTYNMTVTLFEAVYPPVAMLLCGSEGGLQRALLCSYDNASGCLYRETVLRVPTRTAEKMKRVDQFRLALKRPDIPKDDFTSKSSSIPA